MPICITLPPSIYWKPREGVNQRRWQRAHPKIHQKIPGNYQNLEFNGFFPSKYIGNAGKQGGLTPNAGQGCSSVLNRYHNRKFKLSLTNTYFIKLIIIEQVKMTNDATTLSWHIWSICRCLFLDKCFIWVVKVICFGMSKTLC